MKTISFGRSPENDIVIQDVLVSTKHIAISMNEAGAFFIEDLNSTNGTLVQDNLIRGGRQVITLDTIIKIGETTLSWQQYFETQKQEIPSETQNAKKKWLHWATSIIGGLLLSLLILWYMLYVQKP